MRATPSPAFCRKQKAILRPILRKALYGLTFEACGILLGAGVLHLISAAPVDRALILSALNAVAALGWSMIFNTGFEALEARQTIKGRSWLRRAIQAALFDGGLTLLLVPITSRWLGVTSTSSFAYETTLIVFFLAYAAAFFLSVSARAMRF